MVTAVDGAVSSREILTQIQLWTRDYAEWRAWHARWTNRPEPAWFGTRERRQPPVPPEWLVGLCARSAADDLTVNDACLAFREWSLNDDAATAFSQQLAQSRNGLETPD